MKQAIRTVVCTLAFLSCICMAAAAGELPWPIDADRIITSTFAEPRPGRFHLGVDFTSGRAIGKDVYAIGDGYISSVATSPFGYGKLLEFRLADGSSVRYGHLSEFLPAIEDSLEALRESRHTYDVRLTFKPGEFPARAGEVICRSGESGSSSPHLHLELRDGYGNPLNLLARGLAVADTVPPKIGDLVLIPLDRFSSVNGSPLPTRIEPGGEPPHLAGRIGVAAVFTDRTGQPDQHLGIYSAELSVDGEIVFFKRYDIIQADEGRYGGMDYISGQRIGINEYLSALFRRESNPLGCYFGTGVPPIRPEGPSLHRTLRITARDYAENKSSRELFVVFGSRPVITACSFDSPGMLSVTGRYTGGELDRVEFLAPERGAWKLVRTVKTAGRSCSLVENFSDVPSLIRVRLVARDAFRSLACDVKYVPAHPNAGQPKIRLRAALLHDCAAVLINSDCPLASLPVVRIADSAGRVEEIPATPLCDTCWVASAPFTPGRNILKMTVHALDPSLRGISDSLSLDVTRIEPASGADVYPQDGRFSLHAPPGSVYRPAPVSVEAVAANPPAELVPVSDFYRISWGDDPVRGPCRVTFRLDSEPPPGALIYISTNGGDWSCLPSQRPGRLFSAACNGSGILGLFVDETRPMLAPLEPASGGGAGSRTPVIRVRVEDGESGIGGSNAIILLLDNHVVYGEYNSYRKEVRYPVRRALSPGVHRVDAHAVDRAGNRESINWKFTVR